MLLAVLPTLLGKFLLIFNLKLENANILCAVIIWSMRLFIWCLRVMYLWKWSVVTVFINLFCIIFMITIVVLFIILFCIFIVICNHVVQIFSCGQVVFLVPMLVFMYDCCSLFCCYNFISFFRSSCRHVTVVIYLSVSHCSSSLTWFATSGWLHILVNSTLKFKLCSWPLVQYGVKVGKFCLWKFYGIKVGKTLKKF